MHTCSVVAELLYSGADDNTSAGVVKDLFRELPEPLFTSALYRLLLDAATTLGSGPSLGPPKLLLSLLDCLPLAHQVCALCSLLCLLFLRLTLKSQSKRKLSGGGGSRCACIAI